MGGRADRGRRGNVSGGRLGLCLLAQRRPDGVFLNEAALLFSAAGADMAGAAAGRSAGDYLRVQRAHPRRLWRREPACDRGKLRALPRSALCRDSVAVPADGHGRDSPLPPARLPSGAVYLARATLARLVPVPGDSPVLDQLSGPHLRLALPAARHGPAEHYLAEPGPHSRAAASAL